MKLNGLNITFKLDTEMKLIFYNIILKEKVKIEENRTKLEAFGGFKINSVVCVDSIVGRSIESNTNNIYCSTVYPYQTKTL